MLGREEQTETEEREWKNGESPRRDALIIGRLVTFLSFSLPRFKSTVVDVCARVRVTSVPRKRIALCSRSFKPPPSLSGGLSPTLDRPGRRTTWKTRLTSLTDEKKASILLNASRGCATREIAS